LAANGGRGRDGMRKKVILLTATPVSNDLDDVAVTVATERVQYLDAAGKLISESLRDYTRKTVQKEFANLTSFLNTWTNAKRKQAILEELALRGVFSRRPSLTLIVVRFFMKYGQ